jgi:hypothetical protein
VANCSANESIIERYHERHETHGLKAFEKGSNQNERAHDKVTGLRAVRIEASPSKISCFRGDSAASMRSRHYSIKRRDRPRNTQNTRKNRLMKSWRNWARSPHSCGSSILRSRDIALFFCVFRGQYQLVEESFRLGRAIPAEMFTLPDSSNSSV